jgi:hypothetical protein
MPAQTCLLTVEGPHDAEFVARLLRPMGFGRIQNWPALPEYWRAIVPQRFPVGNDLLARHPVPTFFLKATGETVAVRSANGISKIITSLSDELSQLSAVPEAIGIVLDADQEKSPTDRYTELCAEWAAKSNSGLVTFPGLAGPVNAGPPKAGVFILPDNIHAGTLENILIQGAGLNYPNALAAASAYVAGFPTPDLQPEDLEGFNAPAGHNKATVAAVASILKPGKAIQVSIQDSRWLAGAALQLPDVQRVSTFLVDLLC